MDKNLINLIDQRINQLLLDNGMSTDIEYLINQQIEQFSLTKDQAQDNILMSFISYFDDRQLDYLWFKFNNNSNDLNKKLQAA